VLDVVNLLNSDLYEEGISIFDFEVVTGDE
jgi:hypothetical protein